MSFGSRPCSKPLLEYVISEQGRTSFSNPVHHLRLALFWACTFCSPVNCLAKFMFPTQTAGLTLKNLILTDPSLQFYDNKIVVEGNSKYSTTGQVLYMFLIYQSMSEELF